jgi:predicted DNA-binding transcriptional regulator AlpA
MPQKGETQFRKKLSTPEAVTYLGFGKSTLDKWRLTGGGPAYSQLGKRVVYEPADLDAWVEQHKRPGVQHCTASAA